MIRRLFVNPATRRGAWLVDVRRVHRVPHVFPVASSRLLLLFSSGASSDESEEEKKPEEAPWTATEWIPPNRPLAGDLGQSHLYEKTIVQESSSQGEEEEEQGEDDELRQLLEEEENEKLMRLLEEEESIVEDEIDKSEEEEQEEDSDDDTVVDWLQTRRSKMKGQMIGSMSSSLKELKVVEHTLLSRDEIISCLESMGGQDIVEMKQYEQHMGVMILTTCTSPFHISTMADTIVENLKKRKLADMGVVGAQFGAEGSESKQETWRIVDCYNFVLHFMTESTRQHLQLEKLWGEKKGDNLRRINLSNEEAVEDYVAANPIPNEYYNAQERDVQWTTEDITKSLRRNRYADPDKTKQSGKRRASRNMPRRSR